MKTLKTWAEENGYPLLYIEQHARLATRVLGKPEGTVMQHLERLDYDLEIHRANAHAVLLLEVVYARYAGYRSVSFEDWKKHHRLPIHAPKPRQEKSFQDWFWEEGNMFGPDQRSGFHFRWLFDLQWLNYRQVLGLEEVPS